MIRLALPLTILLALSGSGLAQETLNPDEDAIRRNVSRYVLAFNAGNADGIATLWAESGEYVNRSTGERTKGRDQIRRSMESTFRDNPGIQISVNVDSLRMITDSVAMEEGTVEITVPDSPTETTSYSAIHVKKDGQWLLDSIREIVQPPVSDHYEHLKELEWMVGEWVNADDNASVYTSCNWTKNRNFLTRQFSIEIEGQIDLSGTQVIGWDPSEKTVRSWTFDSDGGFSHGTWYREGDRWMVKAMGVLPDGRRASALHIMTWKSDDSFSMQSVGREVDGQLQPNIEEFEIVRQQTNE